MTFPRLLFAMALFIGGCGGNREFLVPLEVFGTADGRALAFVPVFIQERGPFEFLLDTGAARSAIDTELSRELGLPEEGVETVRGIGGEVQTRLVRLSDWRLGEEVSVSDRRVNEIDLPSRDGQRDFHGILGSDVLRDFALVEIDYGDEIMRLELADDDPNDVIR